MERRNVRQDIIKVCKIMKWVDKVNTEILFNKSSSTRVRGHSLTLINQIKTRESVWLFNAVGSEPPGFPRSLWREIISAGSKTGETSPCTTGLNQIKGLSSK